MQDEPNISVAKIAATPTESSWSQAYNAGKLFAVISLSKSPEDEEKDFLNVLGKETIEALEQEYYSLEVKDLNSIKIAFETAVKKIPEGVNFSFVASSVIKNIIYVFYSGQARVSIKRGNEFGILADSKEDGVVQALSGNLKDNDTIVLQTKDFKELVPSEVLKASMDSQPPSEIAETIAPIIHREEKPGAAAVIIRYKAAIEEPVLEKEPEEEKKVEEEKEESLPKINDPSKNKSNIFGPLSMIKLPRFGGINHTRKIILTITVIVAVLLATTVYIAIQKQNEAKVSALFASVYPKAEEKFNEGEGLVSLNDTLASDNFKQAYEILNANKDKFPKGSKEEKQILDLLEKTQKRIEENTPEKIVANEDRSKISLTVENGSGKEGVAGVAADFLKGKGYNVAKTQNADNYKYEGATIKVKDAGKVYIDLLKKDLSEKYEVKNTSSDLPSDSATDAVIIVGK